MVRLGHMLLYTCIVIFNSSMSRFSRAICYFSWGWKLNQLNEPISGYTAQLLQLEASVYWSMILDFDFPLLLALYRSKKTY